MAQERQGKELTQGLDDIMRTRTRIVVVATRFVTEKSKLPQKKMFGAAGKQGAGGRQAIHNTGSARDNEGGAAEGGAMRT